MKPMIAILALGPRLFPGAGQANAADAGETSEDRNQPPKRTPEESVVQQSGNATKNPFSLVCL